MTKANKLEAIQTTIDQIDKDETIIIYGAGRHTRELFESTNLSAKNILAIVDGNASAFKENTLFGYQVLPPEIIGKLNPQKVVISSFAFWRDIFSYLTRDLKYEGEVVRFYDENDANPFYIEVSHHEIKMESELDNIYHCCIQKSASQWFCDLFNDRRVYQYTGMKTHNFYAHLSDYFEKSAIEKIGPSNLLGKVVNTPLDELDFSHMALPEKTIITPLYIGYRSYESIRKPRKYKAFFVLRDPRDIVVSWYYSMKDTHPTITKRAILIREELNKMSKKEGLHFAVEKLSGLGVFQAQTSWVENCQKDPNVKLYRFEELFGANQLNVMIDLFDHLQIPLNKITIRMILAENSFQKKQAKNAHYRNGKSGDWVNHLEPVHIEALKELNGDIIQGLGYEE